MKIIVCQIIGPAAAGSAEPVPYARVIGSAELAVLTVVPTQCTRTHRQTRTCMPVMLNSRQCRLYLHLGPGHPPPAERGPSLESI